MSPEEFREWQKSEPDFHELLDGQPVRLSDAHQVTRRIFRLLVAAVEAKGSVWHGREWIETPHAELRGIEPWRHAEGGWEGVHKCLAWLAKAYPGCTNYDPDRALIQTGAPADLLEEAERFAAIERRRRLSGPGLRTLLAITDLWGLDDAERRRVLGGSPEIDTWIQSARAHHPLALPDDVLAQISSILAIHQALGVLHVLEHEGVEWLRTPHAAPVFGGRPPLDIVINGEPSGPLVVLGFLHAAQQGLYMPPGPLDRHFRPYDDDDISGWLVP
ncbi:hypothetical protein [Paracraurococcus lichenis]|uniref:DUF2384 domain-containing protein n=1 Tax=Paracraurococcus lichenis TaxID=3064888 RepID=A0ABT9DY88_9PROT|nr:hypothetical protein [Paracraurococcus sp. LOR1-02]MDO9708875.1 hypothetical protein [Paracraurococcus sp. LOR1-02]